MTGLWFFTKERQLQVLCKFATEVWYIWVIAGNRRAISAEPQDRPRLIPDVRSGKKQHTIRWGEEKIIPGPMQYVNADEDSDTLVVQVTQVKTMKLCSVARYLGWLEEWPDEVLLSGMREHYPDIRIDSEVAVIHHLVPLT